ncbi:hypothetical protein ACHAWF_014189, partial [Thalassiosira exigua]
PALDRDAKDRVRPRTALVHPRGRHGSILLSREEDAEEAVRPVHDGLVGVDEDSPALVLADGEGGMGLAVAGDEEVPHFCESIQVVKKLGKGSSHSPLKKDYANKLNQPSRAKAEHHSPSSL